MGKPGGGDGPTVSDVVPPIEANHHGQSAIAFNITPSNSNKDYNARQTQHSQTVQPSGNVPSARGGDVIVEPIAFQTRVARNGRGAASDVIPALNGADAGATSDMRPCVAVFKPSHFTRDKDGAPSSVSPPLGAEPDKGDQDAVLFTGAAVRRLTPRECERLQAFPDDYTLVKFRGKPAADGPRYKSLGNAMNVKDIRWILQRIEKFEGLKR